MKKLFFLILFSLSILACKERDADPNVLPAATQTGANTAGCLVDGKVWVASKKYIYPIGGAGTYVENVNNVCKITLDLRNVSNESRILIKAIISDFELNKEYIVPINNQMDYNICSYSPSLNVFYTSVLPNYTGKLKITRLDIQNQIISGTFEFKAVDNNGNIVNITDGRFDKKFD